jgi:hypothetical protein
MFIRIDGYLLKELDLFTSKFKAREILNCINIKETATDIVFAATDGMKLYTFTRKKEDDECLGLGIDSLNVKIPKVKGKGMYYLRDIKEQNRYMLINLLTQEEVICMPCDGNFPKYETVLPAYEDQWPIADKYVSFNWENLKALQTVIVDAKGKKPRAIDDRHAHYWVEHSPIYTKQVVIMPIRCD